MQQLDGRKEVDFFPLAIVVSRFNQEITDQLYDGAIQRLKELNVPEHQITVATVPGAVEIPLTVQRLAQTNRFEAIITLGAVIRGETSHYDYVCSQVSEGCQQIALAEDIPIIFGILTTENVQQAQDRVGGAHGHKGVESVDTAIEMVSLFRQIE